MESKFLGGDIQHTHLVKGLDYVLLDKVSDEKLFFLVMRFMVSIGARRDALQAEAGGGTKCVGQKKGERKS